MSEDTAVHTGGLAFPGAGFSSEDVIWSVNSIVASVSARALLFESRGLLLAVAADAVTEVIEAPEPLPVPSAPAWFNGVTVYNARPVPVLDAAAYLQPESEPSDFRRAVVVRVASSTFMIAADKILNLSQLPSGVYGEQPSGLHGTPDYLKHRAVGRVCQYDKRLLALIDLPELLRCTKLLRECAIR